MSKCNSCGREPFEYVTRCVRCGAAQPLESSGTQPTDVQQLKAEILPLIKQALGEIEGGKFFDAVNPLEQAAAKLSAV